jgi:hypothetical protein
MALAVIGPFKKKDFVTLNLLGNGGAAPESAAAHGGASR